MPEYNSFMFFLNLISFSLSTWLGMFLLARGTHPRPRLTAWSLLFYATTLIINIPGVSLAFRLLPPILWVGSILYLNQHIIDNHPIMHRLWRWILTPVTILLGGFFLFNPSASQNFPYRWISLFLGLTPLMWTLILLRNYIIILQPKQITGLLFTATIFFDLGEGFILFPHRLAPAGIHSPRHRRRRPAFPWVLYRLGDWKLYNDL